jgi:hypothetical protein
MWPLRATVVALLALAGAAAELQRTARPATLLHDQRRMQQRSVEPVAMNRLLSQVQINVCAVRDKDGNSICWTGGHALQDDLVVAFSGVVCEGIQVGKMTLLPRKTAEDNVVELSIVLEEIVVSCGAAAHPIDWQVEWRHHGLRADGTATAAATAATQNSLSVTTTVRSGGSSFAVALPQLPPAISACNTTHVDANQRTQPGFDLDVHLAGTDAAGKIVQIRSVQAKIKAQILDALNPLVCSEIGAILPEALGDVLGELNAALLPFEPYLAMKSKEADVLSAERSLHADIAAGRLQMDLVSLRTDPVVGLASVGLNKLSARAAPQCWTDARGRERCSGPLAVNALLPSALARILPHAQLLPHGGVVISNFLGLFHTDSTIVLGGSGADVEVDIHIAQVRVEGLNTFTRFDLLQLVGDYTVASAVDLAYLGVEVDLQLTVRPNTGTTGVVVVDPTPIVEDHVTVSVSIERPSLRLAMMVAMEESLYGVSIGDMLNDPVGCTFTKLFRSNVTEANATLRDVARPEIKGFSSRDLDETFTAAVQSAFLMYKEIGEQLLPWVTQSEVRDALNNLQASFLAERQHSNCPAHKQAPALSYLDFRSIMFQQINLTEKVSWLLHKGIGVERANEAICELTKDQSGVAGHLVYNHRLVNLNTVLEDFSQQRDTWLAKHPGKTEDNLPAYLAGPGVCLTCSTVGAIHFEVGNLSITGLDSASDFRIFHPKGPNILANHITAGGLQLAVDIRFSIHGEKAPDDGSPVLHIDDFFTLQINVTHATLLADILLKIDQHRFFNLGLEQLLNLSALANTTAAARAVDIGLHFANATVAIDCHRCSSPLLRQMASDLARIQSTDAGVRDVTAGMNDVLAGFFDHFTHDPNVKRQYERELAAYADEAQLEYNQEMWRDNNATCDNFDGPICSVWMTTGRCEADPGYMNEHCRQSCGLCDDETKPDLVDSSVWGFLVGFCMVVLTCGGVVYCFSWRQGNDVRWNTNGTSSFTSTRATRARTDSREETLLPASPPGASHEEYDDVRETLDGDMDGRCEVSLMRDNKHLPLWQRVAVPLALLANMMIFVFGHLNIGASVDIDAHLAGDHLGLDRFVEFSLGHSLVDMWNGKAYSLFFMVGAFSGVWPYTKLLVMLYCWCATPGKFFSKRRRDKVLAACEYAGTWSLIDLYVLSIFILAFRLHIMSPSDTLYIPQGFYLFDVLVTPVSGMYAFIFGVCLSIILNFLMLMLSRRTRRHDGDTARYNSGREMPDTTERLSLRTALQRESHEGRGEIFGWCPILDCLIAETRLLELMLCGSVTLMLVGSLRSSFTFTIYGVAGLAIDAGTPGGHVHEFSLIESILAIGSQGDLDRYAGPLGVWVIACVYGMFCLVVPLAVLAVAGVQLLAPMTLRQQKRLAHLSEGLRAWSALEVFVVAVYVSMLQLSQVSGLILNEACRAVTKFIEPAIQYGLVDVSHFDARKHTNECFIIEAGTLDGIYVLLAAAALSSLTNRQITMLSARAMRERYESSPHAVAQASAWGTEAFGSGVARVSGSLALSSSLASSPRAAMDRCSPVVSEASPCCGHEKVEQELSEGELSAD